MPREELRRALSPADTFVDFETGLNTVIKRLREALRDPAERPRFIETMPKLGYRFIAHVELDSQPPVDIQPKKSVRISDWVKWATASTLLLVDRDNPFVPFQMGAAFGTLEIVPLAGRSEMEDGAAFRQTVTKSLSRRSMRYLTGAKDFTQR